MIFCFTGTLAVWVTFIYVVNNLSCHCHDVCGFSTSEILRGCAILWHQGLYCDVSLFRRWKLLTAMMIVIFMHLRSNLHSISKA